MPVIVVVRVRVQPQFRQLHIMTRQNAHNSREQFSQTGLHRREVINHLILTHLVFVLIFLSMLSRARLAVVLQSSKFQVAFGNIGDRFALAAKTLRINRHVHGKQ